MSVIFWDFDGTLAHSTHLWSGSVYAALQETDPHSAVTFAQIRQCMATGFTWHTPERDYTAYTGEKWWDFMLRHIYASYLRCGAPEDAAKAATAKLRSIIKRTENYTLYEDAIPTLQKMKAMGHTNVLLSNNYPDLGEVLQALELTKHLDGIILSAVEGYDKPRKELFDLAKSRYPSDRYYMVGDNITADILGGSNAGMTTILVHKGFSQAAEYCFPDLNSICDVVV